MMLPFFTVGHSERNIRLAGGAESRKTCHSK